MTSPPPVRPAATVILLRDRPDGLQTWLLTRGSGLAFAAGMSVYPGGRVDDTDGAVELRPAGRAQQVAAALDMSVGSAHRLLAAAARELFEETGVLLAATWDGSARTDIAAEMAAARPAVEAGEYRFAQLLRDHRLAVDADALVPWARWITPESEPRRYDTVFFVAVAPPGVQPANVTTESATADWVDVRAVLAGGRALMLPTRVTLSAVAEYRTAAQVLAAAARQDLRPVAPVIRRVDGTLVAELPDGRRIGPPVSR